LKHAEVRNISSFERGDDHAVFEFDEMDELRGGRADAGGHGLGAVQAAGSRRVRPLGRGRDPDRDDLGDPSKPGMYVTRNRFAPGSGSRPHYHDQDRYVTVIKGTWYVALGPEADVYNRDKMTALKPGSFVVHPAFGHHYDGAKDEEAIVQIMGMGPVKTVQLEAASGTAATHQGTGVR
jgi:quercetin dioxygenase-like cupin family protein